MGTPTEEEKRELRPLYELVPFTTPKNQQAKVIYYALRSAFSEEYLKERGVLPPTESGEANLETLTAVYSLEFKNQEEIKDEIQLARFEEEAKKLEDESNRRFSRLYKSLPVLAGITMLLLPLSVIYISRRISEIENKSPTPSVIECYHHTVLGGESLEGIARYFKSKDPSATIDQVADQNNLQPNEELRAGQDISYCFAKEMTCHFERK